MVPYDELDPGIRNVVRWLNDNGFRTVDSGDGRTKFTEDGRPLPEWDSGDPDYDCVMPFPHAIIAVTPHQIVSECVRLRDLIEARGISVEPQSGPDTGDTVNIQGTYDPACEHPAFILLTGLADSHLES